MHEMSLAQGVIDVIADEARRQAFTGVKRVVLEVGALGCVDPHALAFGFDAVARDTLVQGAVLSIVNVPGQARCFGCEQDVVIAKRGDPCPACGSHQLVVTAGEELRIKELEVV